MDTAMREPGATADEDTGGTAFARTGGSLAITGRRVSDRTLSDLACSIVAARRKLGDHFDATLFANPGLDILMFLFAEGLDGATVTTNACCAAAGVPRTTALRWIKLLQDRGLIEGSDDVSDRRVTMLGLSPPARDTIRAWLTEIVALPLTRPDALLR
ncbi:hypothetical protein M9979_11915 [Sphingomonas sp. RP10(2022)]|uniref:HTH marR-type domain-containing protein n=1 Tax=Sphingomonas liriopis TaxID=2949094 RepID=A0A9X2HR00_9SPHN|nr:hypothetical protein [Sphingomonas liriopis]MCP3735578.1 hypothetical protein [Sphingomonas liriopis]